MGACGGMGRKKSTCLYIDKEILETAKQVGLNVSKVSENALIEAVRLLNDPKPKTRLCSHLDLEGRGRDLNPGAGLHRPSTSILAAFADFLRIDLRLSKATVKEHSYEIRRFLTWLEEDDISLNKVSRATVRDYLKKFEDFSPSTYANVLKSLKRFFRDFHQRPEVVSSFKFPDRPMNLKVVPSREDLGKFYYALEKPIERSLFLFYATSGLRKNEVLSLQKEDIDFKKRMIMPRSSQTRTKRRWVSFFSKEAEKALQEYLSTRKDEKSKLFRIGTHTFNDFWKRAYMKTGIHITPKTLRKWFCTEMGGLESLTGLLTPSAGECRNQY